MSRRIVRRPAAINDLADQTAWYILHAGRAVADRFLQATRHTAERLLRTPQMGAPRHHLNPALAGLRMVPVDRFSRHLIFYRPIPDGIELIRVLHAARDIAALLAAEPGASDDDGS